MPSIPSATARVLTAAGLAAALLSAPAAAQGQTPAPPGQSQQPGSQISEQKLNAAAAAIQQVATIKEDYQKRIAEAAPEEKERIVSEAEGALTKAVTDQGITVEEYSSILTVAQNDPQIREKILNRLRQQQR